MDSRQRVLKALNFEEADRVAVDFDSTTVTGMHHTCVKALREYYGLEKRPVKVCEPFQMLGEIEDDLKAVLGVDTIGIGGKNTMFGFPYVEWKEWRTPHGDEVLVPKDFNTTEDDNNVYIYPEGDMSVGPSAKMPKSSYFFDAIIRQEEIDDDNLNPEDNLEEFKVFGEDDIEYFYDKMSKARKTDKAVVANIGGMGLGDIGLVPATFLKNPKGIRDVAEWYMSTLIRTDYLHEVFEKQTDIALKNLELINNKMGDMIDVMFVCATDFGTQISTFCSADTYKELYMPYYKKVNNWIHQNTNWKTFKHSCGAVYDFIPLLIESGFDILNPVQCSAEGMDPKRLKENFGKDIVFWGGGIDTQQILPFGTPEEVRNQTLERLEIFAKNGGFIFNSIHNIQAKTPVENIVAMFEAVKEFNG